MRTKRLSAVQIVAGVILVMGILFTLLGSFDPGYGEASKHWLEDVASLLMNWGTEAIGIAVTVLLIDWLYERQNVMQEKRDLILQMASPDNAFALEATRKLRLRGWLDDGSLKGADLVRANLRNADLTGANLIGVMLVEANLSNSDLWGANLDNAVLAGADLSGAGLGIYIDIQDGERTFIRSSLRGADLRKAKLTNAVLVGADLQNANLYGADLVGANLHDYAPDEQVTMYGPTIDTPYTVAVPSLLTNLHGVDLREATYDATTIWPAEFAPPPPDSENGKASNE